MNPSPTEPSGATADSRPEQTPDRETSLFDRLRAAPVTILFFVACVVVFVVAEMSGSTTRSDTLLEFGATWRGKVWYGEWWRLFTAIFLHVGIIHLVWNLWAGFSWSAPFEQRLGTFRFALVYLVSGVAGSAASVIGHNAVAAGASGALFGVVGGGLVLMRQELGSWKAMLTVPTERTKLLMVVIWLAIGPWVGFDSFAHAGGMVAGMLLTWALLPLERTRLALSLVVVGALIAASLWPIPGLHAVGVDRAVLSQAWDDRRWSDVVELTEAVAEDDLKPFRAHALIELGRFAEAAPLIPLETHDADNARWLADLHGRVGHPERSFQVLEAAAKHVPADIEFVAEVIFALESTGRYDEIQRAERLADLVVLQSPSSAEGRGFRARQLIRDGKLDEALAPMTEAASRRADPFEAELVMLHAELKRQKQKEILKRGPATSPKHFGPNR